MNVGRMKHWIRIEAPDHKHETVDSYGRRQTQMRMVVEVRAQVTDVSGREFYEAAAHHLENTVTFTTRWISGITPEMSIVWNGSRYSIDHVNHLGYRRDFLRMKAHAIEAEEAQPFGEN